MTTNFYPFSKFTFPPPPKKLTTFPLKRLRKNKNRLRDLTICEGKKLKKRWKFFFNFFSQKLFAFLQGYH